MRSLTGVIRESRYSAHQVVLWSLLALAMAAVTIAIIAGDAHPPWWGPPAFGGFTLVFVALTVFSVRDRRETFDMYADELERGLRKRVADAGDGAAETPA